MSTVIETVARARNEKNDRAMDRYAEIVVALADDVDLDPSEVEAVLQAAGKSPSDLSNDVRRKLLRRRLQGTIDAAEAAQAEVPEIDEAIEAAREVLAVAERIFNETVAPLQMRKQNAQQKAWDALTAKQQLKDGAAPRLHERLRAIQRELGALDNMLFAHDRGDGRDSSEVTRAVDRRTLLRTEADRIVEEMYRP